MKIFRVLITLAVFVFVAALNVVPNSFGANNTAQAAILFSNKIEPSVLAQVENGDTAQILVTLREQADLSGAAKLRTKEEKGEFVFNALRATADRAQAPLRARLDRLGVTYSTYYIANLIVIENANRALVEQLAAREEVARIESDAKIRLELPIPQTPLDAAPLAPTAIEWNISKINAPAVWAQGFRGQGIVYANADTGVQWGHPALKQHYRGWNISTSTVNHNYNWWDAVHRDLSGEGTNPCGFSVRRPCDDYGHGTHTMGTGVGDDGAGNQIGVAPGAKWISCRNMEQGYGRPSQYIECFQFFLAPWNLNRQNANPHKAPDVISNSWTCPLGPPPNGENCTPTSLQTAVQNERAAGIFVAASAGNSGPNCSTVDEPPANYDGSTTVGATDSNDALASFSSRGPVTIDGSNRLKPDISAPGVGVRSSFRGSTYQVESGTSMASPHIAGAVALLWNARPALRGNVNATENVLFNTAYRNVVAAGTCGGTTSVDIPNNLFGYGRVDVLAAVNSVP